MKINEGISKQYDAGNLAENYTEASSKNEQFDLSRKFLREEMQRIPKDSVVLDVGCGSGIDLKSYKELGFKNLFGIDPSQKLLDEAKDLLGDDLPLSLGSFENIPYGDESFDVLVSRHALHYSKDLEKSLIESARVLKKEGKFIVVMSDPQADALEKTDEEGNITITLFGGKVPITFPRHKAEDYFSKTFHENFELISQNRLISKEQDRSINNTPNTFCFVALKRVNT